MVFISTIGAVYNSCTIRAIRALHTDLLVAALSALLVMGAAIFVPTSGLVGALFGQLNLYVFLLYDFCRFGLR